MQEEIKEERSADEARKHGNAVIVDVDDLWVKYMEAKLAFKSEHCKPSHPFTICRVPRDIRSVDNVAHDPLIVSIGPYHRGNPSLHEMEEVKWRNLKKIRLRAGNNFKDCLKELKKREPEARACYSGNINMAADEFIEMMLLDGLFIIELLSKWVNRVIRLQDPNIVEEETIFTISGMWGRVGVDMLLLENQLPFFVLERLWNLASPCGGFNLWKSAFLFIVFEALPIKHEGDLELLKKIFNEKEKKTKNQENPEMINEDGVHHLLHLVYLFLSSTKKSVSVEPTGSSDQSKDSTAKLPTGSSDQSMDPTAKLPTGSSDQSKDPTAKLPAGSSDQSKDPTAKLPAFIKKILSFLPPRCHSFPSPSARQKSQFMECTKKLSAFIQKIPPSLSPCKSKVQQPPPLTVIPCAVELDEAGVEFQCVNAESFLDIKFEQGTMKMPHLWVVDSTKSFLRNFIAYEQCFPNRGNQFTSYCNFMDHLVNTPRDVEILKKSGIIGNCLGCDKEVADLFNDLCKGIVVPGDSCNYLAKPSKDVRKHTEKVWPRWRAKLLHDYFGSPWTIISFLGATIVIILTIVQTYYAVFT